MNLEAALVLKLAVALGGKARRARGGDAGVGRALDQHALEDCPGDSGGRAAVRVGDRPRTPARDRRRLGRGPRRALNRDRGAIDEVTPGHVASRGPDAPACRVVTPQLALVFPLLVAAPRYFARQIMLGGLMQTAQAFGQVQGALSFIVNSYPDLARWRAAVDRLVGFERALRSPATGGSVGRRIEVRRSPTPALQVDDLDIDLPSGAPLLRALSFTVLPGRSLLIVGPAGAGKTTLLRAIAGIWPYGRGRIAIPDTGREVIMPEKPYLPVGTLRQALTYPQVDARIAGDDLQWDPRQIGSAQHAGLAERDGEAAYSRAPIGPEGSGLPTDADLQRALALCGVTHLASRLDDEQNWSQRLSLDEQKRLAFARLLVQRPDRIFLDETTSDLDEESALYLYRTLREELPGAMVITVGHLGPLQQLHGAHLELRRCGKRS